MINSVEIANVQNVQYVNSIYLYHTNIKFNKYSLYEHFDTFKNDEVLRKKIDEEIICHTNKINKTKNEFNEFNESKNKTIDLKT